MMAEVGWLLPEACVDMTAVETSLAHLMAVVVDMMAMAAETNSMAEEASGCLQLLPLE